MGLEHPEYFAAGKRLLDSARTKEQVKVLGFTVAEKVSTALAAFLLSVNFVIRARGAIFAMVVVVVLLGVVVVVVLVMVVVVEVEEVVDNVPLAPNGSM